MIKPLKSYRNPYTDLGNNLSRDWPIYDVFHPI